MIKENGKYIKFDARIFANSGDMAAYDKSMPVLLDPIPSDKIAIHLNCYKQTSFRFAMRPKPFKIEPTFKDGLEWSATHTIDATIDAEHNLRMEHKIEAMHENTNDITQNLRNYCEGYFYVLKMCGEENSGVARDDARKSFYNHAHYMMDIAEMYLAPGIISDVDMGLAVSCEQLLNIGVLKPRPRFN